MANQTFQFLLHTSPDLKLIFFIFFATICSYSFHWCFTTYSVIPSPRVNWALKNKNIHLTLFIIGLAGAAFFFILLTSHWHLLLPASIITFLYSAPKIPHPYFRVLRKVAFGKTIFLALVWTYVTAILPLLISQQAWKQEFVLFVLSRFFLIYAICILFDLRDQEDDKAAGIRSLVTLLSKQNVSIVFIMSLSLFAVTTIWMQGYYYQLLSIFLLLLPGLVVGCLYKYAENNFSDMLYYFVLDGLMALSAILMLITSI